MKARQILAHVFLVLLIANAYAQEIDVSLDKALSGHTDRVCNVAFSPDGQTLASGSLDKSIKLWNVATGQQLRTLSGHTGGVKSVVFSPDGRILASGSSDLTVRLWNVETGSALNTLAEGSDCAFFSPDGRKLAGGRIEHLYRKKGPDVAKVFAYLWDVGTGTLIHTLADSVEDVGTKGLFFSPGLRILATGLYERSISLWDVETGRKTNTLKMESIPWSPSGQILGMAFSPDGRILASGGTHDNIYLWDIETGRMVKTLERRTPGMDQIKALAFSPDGQILASGNGKKIELWDLETGRVLETMSGHSECVTSLTFSADGRILASGSDDTTIKLWRLTQAGNEVVVDKKKFPEGGGEATPIIKEGGLHTPAATLSAVPLLASDVDKNIPIGSSNPDAVALVIGNSNYKQFNPNTPNVDFAGNDAATVKEYLMRLFGVREDRIVFYNNATKGQMENAVGDEKGIKNSLLWKKCKTGKSDVFVYYSGHGAPSIVNQEGYLVPVDADPSNIETGGYPLNQLFKNLSQLQARKAIVILDACFSGMSNAGPLIAGVSPVGIEVQPQVTMRNSVVITATSENEFATWNYEQQHGMLTYFLLRGLKGEADANHDGQIQISELEAFLTDQNEGVPYASRNSRAGQEQNPQVIAQDKSKVIVEVK